MTAASLVATSFAALFAGHHIGDHIAQTDWQASNKAAPGWRGAWAMAGHLTTYTTCQALALAGLQIVGVPLPDGAGFAGLAFSVATHGFIDRRWPVRWLLEHTGSAPFSRLASGGVNGMYLADQSLHVGCLFISALIVGGLS